MSDGWRRAGHLRWWKTIWVSARYVSGSGLREVVRRVGRRQAPPRGSSEATAVIKSDCFAWLERRWRTALPGFARDRGVQRDADPGVHLAARVALQGGGRDREGLMLEAIQRIQPGHRLHWAATRCSTSSVCSIGIEAARRPLSTKLV